MTEPEERAHDPDDAAVEAAATAVIEAGDTAPLGPAVLSAGPVGTAGPEATLLSQVYAFWQDLAAADPDGRPRRADVRPEILGGTLGNLLLLESVRDGFDARYRVYGGTIAAHAGADWSGYLVSEMNRATRTGLALFYRSIYRAVWRTGQPFITRHRSPDWIRTEAWDRLVLPLWGEGAAPAFFLTAIVPIAGRVYTAAEINLRSRRLKAGKGP